MFDTLAKILNVKELRGKLVITFLLLVVFRLGSFIPTPGVNVAAITEFISSAQGGAMGAVMSMADMFTGGALSSMAIFGLGIMPYITASIIFQLLTAIIPSLSRIAHEGATGRKKINQYVRASTVVLCLIQSGMIAWAMATSGDAGSSTFIAEGVSRWEFFFYVVLSLTAGTMFLMWLGEQIDEFGIGNGISLLIMAGILSRIPRAIFRLVEGADPTSAGSSITLGVIVLLVILFVAMTLAVVMITLGTRRVPIMQAKAVRGRKTYGGQRQFLPLKVNQANVIPIIFGQAIMQVVAGFVGMILGETMGVFFSPGSFWYTVCYIILILFFCYFYTAIQFNPNEIADNLKQGGMYIPGIRPGKRTAEHLEKIMNRIALAGGVFLAIIAVVPQFISRGLNVDYDISGLLGGTGLLIVVGVALDVVQRIESYLLMRNYEGFGLAGGKIKGRRG
ncbi:MAG: preprotein translocase subunit SecY [Planctomycetota bacterium]|jgi:preprotein translocase subunit SecY|nr:preprotein translocase subunit SecY [Planctomycetota bacterium]